MALPPRVFFSLYEVSVRWDCSVADIAGWASQGKLKIMTGIGLVRCGDSTVAGTVTLWPMDLLPLFRHSGPTPTEGMVQRIMPDGSSDWLIITDPAGGVSVTVADMLIRADEVFGFEDEHDLVRKAAGGANGGQPYDWAGMNIALIRRIHDQGLPATQAELIAEMQDWFADQTGGARIPDSRSIRRRITPIWHELRREGAWLRLPPRTGWRAWVEDEGLLLVYDGSSWIGTTPNELQNLALLGLGTTADAANPFSAKLNAALWTAKTVAEGGTGDLFYTMNKEAAGDDLGLTLQTNFVTKALVGLFGSDSFRLAVSADGSTFFDGLTVDNGTGIVEQPQLPRFKAWTNYDNYVGVGTWTKIGLNNTDYNDQGAFDAANNYFVAPVDGTYLFGGTLLYKINASATARMRGRLVLNGATEIRGSFGEISATHVSLATAIWLQTIVPLTAGDTVELQGYFRVADGYFAADHTSFWGCKVG